MKYSREWEAINKKGGAFRLKVHGGWIFTDGYEGSIMCCFVPDPNHEWELEDENE